MLIDELKNLSFSAIQKLIKHEQNSNWIDVLWTSQLLCSIAKSMLFLELWLLVVSANLNLAIIIVCFGIYHFTSFLAGLICGLLNNRSQFAKIFLIFASVCGILTGGGVVFSSNNYDVEVPKTPETEKIDDDTKSISLFPMQVQGLSIKAYIGILSAIGSFALWESILN